MLDQDNPTEYLKFYSLKAIGIATFLGGPMAAGYLIRENFLALNEPKSGKKALIIGIISTIILLAVSYLLPDSIMDKLPSMLFPAISIGVVYFIVDKMHGEMLKKHKACNNTFLSAWKAAGIGVISLIITLVMILVPILLSTDFQFEQKYNEDRALFMENQAKAVKVYDNIDTDSNASLLKQVEEITIPAWKENIEIMTNLNQLDNIPPELVNLIPLMLDYSKLRLEASELMKKHFSNNGNQYDRELNLIHEKIDQMTTEMNVLQ